MVGQKRWDFKVPAGRLRDAGGKREFAMLRKERESHQPPAISGGVTIGCFPDWALRSWQEIRNTAKLRADFGC